MAALNLVVISGLSGSGKSHALKALEEAVETLNAEKLALLMFVNALSGSIQVLQRLPNGRLSLIDPASDRARVAHGRA